GGGLLALVHLGLGLILRLLVVVLDDDFLAAGCLDADANGLGVEVAEVFRAADVERQAVVGDELLNVFDLERAGVARLVAQVLHQREVAALLGRLSGLCHRDVPAEERERSGRLLGRASAWGICRREVGSRVGATLYQRPNPCQHGDSVGEGIWRGAGTGWSAVGAGTGFPAISRSALLSPPSWARCTRWVCCEGRRVDHRRAWPVERSTDPRRGPRRAG